MRVAWVCLLLSLAVAPVSYGENPKIEVGNPWKFSGQGFFFAPDRLTASLLACVSANEIFRKSWCETDVFSEMVEDYQKAKELDQPPDLKQDDLVQWARRCLGPTERRFTEQFRQPDGVLFVPVKPTEGCTIFAYEWTYFAAQMARARATPRTGLALEHAVVPTEEWIEERKSEKQPEIASKSPDAIEASDLHTISTLPQKKVDELKKAYASVNDAKGGEPVDAFLSLPSSRRIRALLDHRHHHARTPFYSSLIPAAWLTKRVVPYSLDGTVNPATQELLCAAIDVWEAKTCVRWKATFAGAGVLPVKAHSGGSSGWPAGLTIRFTADSTVMEHELGHVLGLGHTNQRADRDVYIHYNEAKAFDVHQFDTRTEAITRNQRGYAMKFDAVDLGVWDWGSVMLYGSKGGVNAAMNHKKLSDYSEFEQWAYDWLFGTGGYPPHEGKWGFTGKSYGGATVSEMDSHIVNLKWQCYAVNPKDGTHWDTGAQASLFTQCEAGFTRKAIVSGDVTRPLCIPDNV